MATAELVLEAPIDALTRRAFVIANVLRKLEANPFQAPGFHVQFLLQGFVPAGVDVDQRNMAE